ncbi:MAG: magnesium/cobalt transporter CorA [Bryobacterales bacterium]|nr:magnesium/cobalt transporter CorA [Bryobacterales bacterium]
MRWFDIRKTNNEELDRLGEEFRLHPLHIEDCRHGNQNGKVEEGDGYLFVVVKPVEITKDGTLSITDLDVFVGPDYVITVDEDGASCTAGLLERLQARTNGQRPDHMLYRLLDSVVDLYVPVLDRYGDMIDALEDRALDDASPATVETIFQLKRELIVMRRVLQNMRDVAGHLQRTESTLIRADLLPFLRDVYDHLARNLDLVEMQRDLLSGAMDIYLSSVANRTNQVMKVLTVLSTIALPALVISGFYGMNVKHLPWAETPGGVLVVAGLMASSTIILLWVLRRFNWL